MEEGGQAVEQSEIYIDGSTQNICVIIGHEIIIEPALVGHKVSNNQGEYYALLKALQVAQAQGIRRATIYSDSELLVRQLTLDAGGFPIYKIKSPNLKNLHKTARTVIDCNFDRITLKWIPREENLAGIALERLGH